MALYIVHRKNPYFKNNTILEDGDDGYVQQVRTHTKGGRMAPGGYHGIMIPVNEMRPYMIRMMEKGFDFQPVRFIL